jgi:hypothetical protein
MLLKDVYYSTGHSGYDYNMFIVQDTALSVLLTCFQRYGMDKLQLTGQNLGRVFNSSLGCARMYCYAEWHYAECHYAECHYAECHYAECH